MVELPVFCPDSKRLAFAVLKGKMWQVEAIRKAEKRLEEAKRANEKKQ